MVSPPACVEKGWNAPLSRAVRDGIEAAVPVIVAGRVADEQTAQGIIDRGDADMVAMGRALIADPFLPAKVAAGEARINDQQVFHCCYGTSIGTLPSTIWATDANQSWLHGFI